MAMAGVDDSSLQAGRFTAQEGWFGLMVSQRPLGAIFTRQMNRVNSDNDFVVMTAP